MEHIPAFRCPKCNVIHWEKNLNTAFYDGLNLSIKCHCGCEFDVNLKLVPTSFWGKIIGKKKLIEIITIRGG